MSNTDADIGRILASLPGELPAGRRYVVAIAGPPAAGKSTIAERLRDELAPWAAVLGMDAFHLDDAVLATRGHLDRKGAPHTFDCAGYRRCLEVLRADTSQSIAVPVFDRTLELSRNAAEIVTPEHAILITEGNYLLLDEEPWTGLADLFDLTVMVTADMITVEKRIRQRWASFGLGPATAAGRFGTNDGPNAQLVLSNSRPADLTFEPSLR